MGQVPALQLDDGTVLTEGVAVAQYIADLAPQSGLAPAAGTIERYRLMSLLNFVSTELHKAFAPLFRPTTPEAYKEIARKEVAAIEHVEKMLRDRPYLMGERFTVADAYLFSVLKLSGHIGIDLTPYAAVARYMERIAARPAVQQAMQAEGLLAVRMAA
jgi:glutathione S-transferase